MAEARKRGYAMGRRGSKTSAKPARDQYTKGRWAWCTTFFGTTVIWGDHVEDEDGNKTDDVLDIKLIHSILNRAPMILNLTASTEEELLAFKELVNKAIDLALPVARERDTEAQHALTQGDDSFARLYRAAPQLVYREGPFREHRQGVLDRPKDVPEALRGSGGVDGPVRDDGPDVAEPDPSDGSASNDPPQVDDSPVIRQVGTLGD